MLLTNAVNTEGRPLEIYVKDGKIAAVGQDLSALAAENETVVDAGGLTVLPAFVDLHCHWRTPGFEYKEDIETGSRAAAAGGYTFVNLMPNTKPVCSSAALHALRTVLLIQIRQFLKRRTSMKRPKRFWMISTERKGDFYDKGTMQLTTELLRQLL